VPIITQQNLTQRTSIRKHSKVEFIVDKRTGARFKYKEYKNNDDIYNYADGPFSSSMMIN
jgi:hypothetical protein